MTELGRKRGDEREEGERRTNGNDRESEGRGRKERMPLFVNQSAVSERENSKNPQREEEDGGHPGGMVLMVVVKLVVGGATEKRRRVPPTPSANRVAFLVGGSWESTNSLELQRKNTRRAGRSCDLTF